MIEFITFGRTSSEIALEARRLKLNGLSYQEFAISLKLEGKRKLDPHKKAKRLVQRAIRAGLLGPVKAIAYRKEALKKDYLSRIRPMGFENLSAEEMARGLIDMTVKRDFVTEVIQKLKKIALCKAKYPQLVNRALYPNVSTVSVPLSSVVLSKRRAQIRCSPSNHLPSQAVRLPR
jgi:hypothetical protein